MTDFMISYDLFIFGLGFQNSKPISCKALGWESFPVCHSQAIGLLFRTLRYRVNLERVALTWAARLSLDFQGWVGEGGAVVGI